MSTIIVMGYNLEKIQVEVKPGDRVNDVMERATQQGARGVKGWENYVVEEVGYVKPDNLVAASWKKISPTRQQPMKGKPREYSVGTKFRLQSSHQTWEGGVAEVGTIVEYAGFKDVNRRGGARMCFKVLDGDQKGQEIITRLLSDSASDILKGQL